jgi:hypothetical protein
MKASGMRPDMRHGPDQGAAIVAGSVGIPEKPLVRKGRQEELSIEEARG